MKCRKHPDAEWKCIHPRLDLWMCGVCSEELANLKTQYLVPNTEPVVKVQPMASAPLDGTPFLAYQDREFYVAKHDEHGRLMFRTHSLFVGEKHQVFNTEFEGKIVTVKLPIDQPWEERFDHSWTIWTDGFEFKPTGWSPLPEL